MDQSVVPASRSMEPPKKPQPTQRYKKEEWEVHRDLIVRMYPTRGMTLKAIKDILEQDHNFIVNERQLKKKIDDWKIAKNVQRSEIDFIARKNKQRTMKGTFARFRVRGQPVDSSKMLRGQKRHGISLEVTNSPIPSTPSDISYSPASIRSASPHVVDGRYQTSLFSTSSRINQDHRSSLQHMAMATSYEDSTEDGRIIISDFEHNSFEGQSPAPFTPISSPALPHRMEPTSQRDLSGTDANIGVHHHVSSHFQDKNTLNDPSSASLASPKFMPLDTNVANVANNPNTSTGPRKTRYREAEEIELRQRLNLLESTHGSNHPATLDTMARLAAVLRDQGRLRSAEHFHKQVAEASQATFGADDLRTIVAFLDLAKLLCVQSRFIPAERLCRRLSTKVETLVPAEHSINLQISTTLGECLVQMGRYAEAEKMFLEVIKLGGRTREPDDDLLIHPMYCLSKILNLREDFVGAERNLRAILGCRNVEQDPKDCNIMSVQAHLGYALAWQGRFDESETLLRQVYADQARVLGPEHQDVLVTQDYLAWVLRLMGSYEESERISRSVVQKSEKTLGGNHADTLKYRLSLVNILIAQDRLPEAETSGKELLAVATEILGADHVLCFDTQRVLGICYERQGHLDKALGMFRMAFEGCARMLGGDHSLKTDCKRRLMEVEARIARESTVYGVQCDMDVDLYGE